MKERLEEKVLQEILPPDVYDKCIVRPELCDVGKVLVGPYPEVYASLDAELPQFPQRMQVGGFIGYEVVIPKVSSLFGDPLDDCGELAGCDRLCLAFQGGRPRERERQC